MTLTVFWPISSRVGVPVISPVNESILNPSGRFVAEYVAVGLATDVAVYKYSVPATNVCAGMLARTGTVNAAPTLNTTSCISVSTLFVAVIVTFGISTCVGVPDILRTSPLTACVSPAGKFSTVIVAAG